MPTSAPEMTWVVSVAAVVGALLLLLLLVLLVKNRPMPEGEVFVASRWTRGNRLFPTQVAITPESVIQRKPQWLGRWEESIHVSHVASVRIDTGLLFSEVVIETSGGSEPIVCHGHSKADATRMKDLLEQHQTLPAPPAAVPAAGGSTRTCPFCAEVTGGYAVPLLRQRVRQQRLSAAWLTPVAHGGTAATVPRRAIGRALPPPSTGALRSLNASRRGG